jgi:hypothetical protein
MASVPVRQNTAHKPVKLGLDNAQFFRAFTTDCNIAYQAEPRRIGDEKPVSFTAVNSSASWWNHCVCISACNENA